MTEESAKKSKSKKKNPDRAVKTAIFTGLGYFE